jgi:hypothetical protein
MLSKTTNGVTTYADGREKCCNTPTGKAEYKRRVWLMWLRQKKRCCICWLWLRLENATFEHQDGRGMGGSTRDDRIEKDGHPYNGAACWKCNNEKGSKRMNYNEVVD